MNQQEVLQKLEQLINSKDINNIELAFQLAKSQNILDFPYFFKLDLSNIALVQIPLWITEITTLTHLSFKDCRLYSVPPEIKNLVNLKELNLHSNVLKNLPLELSLLPSLEKLDVSYNFLTEFTSYSPLLKNLNVSVNDLHEINIDSCKQLEILNLSDNNDIFEVEIGNANSYDIDFNHINFPNLEELYCDNIEFTNEEDYLDLQEVLKERREKKTVLNDLKIMLQSGDINNIKQAFQLAKKHYIDLETHFAHDFHYTPSLWLTWVRSNYTSTKNTFESYLTFLFEHIFPITDQFSVLEELELAQFIINFWMKEQTKNIDIKQQFSAILKTRELTISKEKQYDLSIPPVIQHLKQLEVFEVEGSYSFTEIPETILHLKNLKVLRLQNSNIAKISSKIEQLQNLEILDLSNSRVVELPSEIGQLKKLKTLIISGKTYRSVLNKLPSEIVQLSNLEILDLSGNQLINIPSEIGQLKYLKHLDLGKNKLQSIPISIGELKHLEHFNLSCNKIKKLPFELKKLQKLTALHLQSNSYNDGLEEFPTAIQYLKNLEYLDISYNENITLKKFISFKKLSKLEFINIRETSAIFIDAILEHLFTLPNLKKFEYTQYDDIAFPQQTSKIQQLNKIIEKKKDN